MFCLFYLLKYKMKFYEYLQKIKTPERLKNHLVDQNNETIKYVAPLSKVNIFIGANNSGKSLLIRELTRQVLDETFINKNTIDSINQIINESRKEIEAEFTKKSTHTFHGNGIDFSFDLINAYLPLVTSENSIEENISKIEKAASLTSRGFSSYSSGYNSSTYLQGNDTINNTLKINLNKIKSLLESHIIKKNYFKIYIPTIRTLRVYNDSKEFENKTREEYNFTNKENITDQTLDSNIIIQNGQNFYDQIYHLRNSSHDELEKLQRYEYFLSKHFFNDNKISFVTNAKKKTINIQIGNEKAQPIFNLGDGLQMIIINTFPFFNFESGIVIIEEPELFIHPALQQTNLFRKGATG